MSISAMKQALQALELIDKDIEWHDKSPTRKFCNQAAHFLRQAIEQAEKHLKEWPESKADHLIVNPEIAKMLRDFVHASDINQERVDETAKRKHEFECPRCGHCCQQREWVGLDGDIPGLGLVTEEFYNGMICAEDILRKKNT